MCRGNLSEKLRLKNIGEKCDTTLLKKGTKKNKHYLNL
jgi:hypothetical protein